MPERTAEPLSPELILVSPPEEAALAREQLGDPPQSLRREPRPRPAVVPVPAPAAVPEPAPAAPAGPSDLSWNEFLADVRNRPADPVVTPRPRPPVPVRRKGRKRLVVATTSIAVLVAVVGLAWARDHAQQKPRSSASSLPVPSHRSVGKGKAQTHAKTTPAPKVTTASRPRSSPSRKSSKPPTPRAKHTAGFVPTRVWSWAAASGSAVYVVRFLRDGHLVLKIRAGAPRLELPARFTFVPGHYRWTVTAIPQNGGTGHVIVNSSFTVNAQNG